VGRLFWKFFIFIWLGQLTTILGVSTVWIIHHNENLRSGGADSFAPAAYAVESAAATLQYGGSEALKNLLRSKVSPPLFAVDETGHDLLGRAVLPEAITQARQQLNNGATISEVKQVKIERKTYLLFLPLTEGIPNSQPAQADGEVVNHAAQNSATRHNHATNAARIQQRRLFPWISIIAATIASFIFASLLAWYFSKPIRSLRSAFEAVASGNFKVDLNSIMDGRRDDLADLGRDFDRMTSQLRSLIEGQRRLLHDISHELRSPLARLQVAVGLARQQPDKIESSMVRIERESTRMDHLVGELLTLSKLEAGVAGSLKETIDLKDLLADIVDDAQFEARAQGKEVELVGNVNATIQGSAELIHRAIENVIRNAIKHSPAGSKIIMDTSEDSSNINIDILDSGVGVPESELELIFEPFFRSNSSGNSADGHGLGLAIARRVIEAHCGNIRATNRKTGGLLVEMIIPVAKANI
jgi:two-component system OmpR family sensor kinase